MKDFCLWFLQQLPTFLLSEPICYLIGFAFLLLTVKVFTSLCHINSNMKGGL